MRKNWLIIGLTLLLAALVFAGGVLFASQRSRAIAAEIVSWEFAEETKEVYAGDILLGTVTARYPVFTARHMNVESWNDDLVGSMEMNGLSEAEERMQGQYRLEYRWVLDRLDKGLHQQITIDYLLLSEYKNFVSFEAMQADVDADENGMADDDYEPDTYYFNSVTTYDLLQGRMLRASDVFSPRALGEDGYLYEAYIRKYGIPEGHAEIRFVWLCEFPQYYFAEDGVHVCFPRVEEASLREVVIPYTRTDLLAPAILARLLGGDAT